MIRTKTTEEIARLTEGGAILAFILDELEQMMAPGLVARELDERARSLCQEQGVTPAFLGYAPGGHEPFPAAVCVSINNAVVHGVPGEQVLAEGDVVGIDMGIIYEQKYFLDSARTVAVGEIAGDVRQLLDVTEKALEVGIAAAQVGAKTGDIGHAIESYINSLPPTEKGETFGIVRELVGHGVGFAVHEEPSVPNFGKAGRGTRLPEGIVIAIEPMITLGDAAIGTAADGWTIVTASGRPAAHEEHTVAVTADGPKILTKR